MTSSVKPLLKIAVRHLFRHPWQSALMVVGITLGVAVAVAIDLANASASRAFSLSTEAVTGRATHQLSGGPGGLDESLYTGLRREGLLPASAPVVTYYVSSPQLGGRPLQLLGVDPFAERPFRDYLAGESGAPLDLLAPFLARPGAVMISSELAARYGLASGDALTLDVGGRPRQAFLAGLLSPQDDLSRRALEGLVLADVATAQELGDRLGVLDRIDLILEKDCPIPGDLSSSSPACQALLARLPAGVRLAPVEARAGAINEMTAAFRLNLTALSLLALVVGLFLIYNTMTFSVVQRRSLFGALRCLGVTRQEVFLLVAGEALLVGVAGATLGLLLGVLMGQVAVRLVTQTISDLYFTVTVTGVQVPPGSLVKGILLGVLATVLTAAPPAWEAASGPPRQALSRASLEGKARRAVALAALLGTLFLSLGGGLLALPSGNLVVSFAGTFGVILGFAMLAPVAASLAMRLVGPLLGRVFGTLGSMAPRDVVNSLSRTSVAVAALTVAVSVTIGVSLMVSSFRYTVIAWLDQSLQGDIYISTPSLSAGQPSGPVDPQIVAALKDRPDVARLDVLRAVEVDSPAGFIHLAATNNQEVGLERRFFSSLAPPEQIWQRLEGGALIISEPLAARLGLPRQLPSQPPAITLFTDSGPQEFPVVGVFADYTTSQGVAVMSLQAYRSRWDDPAVTGLALRLQPGVDAGQAAAEIQDQISPRQSLLVRPNRLLRENVLEVFDRTFAITGALQILATVVAFVGILSALLSLELERQRELGILRAIGLTARQLWGLIMLETGILGSVAGLLAMPTGLTLAVILIYIINRRSFGWTLQMQVQPEPFLLSLVVAVAAAILAGIYPSYRMSRMSSMEAIRNE